MGTAAKMKLVTNLVLGLNRAALAEGLVLASSFGLDPQLTLEVLQASAAYSKAMDAKGAKMIGGDFAPQARLSQHLKDVRLLLAAAARTGRTLPLSETHRKLLEFAESLGLAPKFSCRSGICGTCTTGIVEGAVDYLEDPVAPRGANEVLLCCSVPRPGTNVVLDL